MTQVEASMVSLSVSSPGERPLTRSQKKYLKKKEKKKKVSTEHVFQIEEEIEPVSHSCVKSFPEVSTQISDYVPPSADKESSLVDIKVNEKEDSHRQVRTIRKKLKQIADLESRIVSGSITKPDQHQLQKLARKEEYQQQLAKLMF